MFHVAFEKTGQMRENVLSWAIKFGLVVGSSH